MKDLDISTLYNEKNISRDRSDITMKRRIPLETGVMS